MARTCRSWHEQALDRVWEDMDASSALETLLSLLPSDVYKPRPKDDWASDSGQWLRTPNQEEYESLFKYSQRVRVLDLHDYLFGTLHVLCDHPPPRPLFPRLKALMVDCPFSRDRPLAVLLSPFSSGALSRVSVNISARPRSEPAPEIDLDAISSLAVPGHGVCLEICGFALMPTLVGARQDIIRKIEIGNVRSNSWRVMAALPCLESLTISWTGRSRPIAHLPSVDRPFRALSALEVRAYEDSKPFVADMLRCCGRVSLSSLALYTACDEHDTEADSTNNWTLLFRAMQNHCVRGDLRVLRIHDCKETMRVQDMDLKLLLPFHRLTTLSLHNHGGFSVNDATFVSLLQAWTLLRTLELVTPDIESSLAMTTRHINTCAPTCLLEIARHGVSLESLALIVDWEAGLSADWEERLPQNMNPVELDFWNSGVDDPFDAADLILAAFPAVNSLRVSQLDIYEHSKGSREHTMSDRWGQVRDRVWVAQKAMRRQAECLEKSRVWKQREGLGWDLARYSRWDQA